MASALPNTPDAARKKKVREAILAAPGATTLLLVAQGAVLAVCREYGFVVLFTDAAAVETRQSARTLIARAMLVDRCSGETIELRCALGLTSPSTGRCLVWVEAGYFETRPDGSGTGIESLANRLVSSHRIRKTPDVAPCEDTADFGQAVSKVLWAEAADFTWETDNRQGFVDLLCRGISENPRATSDVAP